MFTNEAQSVIDHAKDIATSRREAKLTWGAIASALALNARGLALFAECLAVDSADLKQSFPVPDPLQRCQGKLPLAPEVRDLLRVAKGLVSRFPSHSQPSLISLPHLVCAVASAVPPDAIPGVDPAAAEHLERVLANMLEQDGKPASLGDLTRRLRALRQDLLDRVFGQEHAVHQFIEGLFNVEVAAADTTRRKPAGLFVFAGPPGVGKTYLAELGASSLNRPYKRFDMSTYALGHEATTLTGTARVYQGAQPGTLTDFVQRNPNAILLFDEIEKAHHSTIHLFLQILDAGRLQDKYTEQHVEFRDTIVVFTTNVGRQLYENENAAGVHQANASFHRSTILDALRTEIDPHTRAPFFPAAICSRMATGYPILFNRMTVKDLSRIAAAELSRVAALLEKQHGQHYAFTDEVPMALVVREGGQTDARTVKAVAESFLKEEVFKTCQLFSDEHVDEAFRNISEISVEIDKEHAGELANRLFWDQRRPAVLFVGDPFLAQFYGEVIPEIEWCSAANPDQVFDILARRSVDFVLLDLALQASVSTEYPDLGAAFHDLSERAPLPKTELHFDHAPLAARRYSVGQQLLERLHARMPEVPIYLLSLQESSGGFVGTGVDEELLLACVRAGGARGAIRTAMGSRESDDFDAQRESLRCELESVAKKLREQKMAEELARNNHVVLFDTAPAVSELGDRLQIRCRNFRLVRAIRGSDAGSLVSDIERPATQFEDVIGAKGAKEALIFVRDWLRDPKTFAAAGVEPPRGVLLTGPPGTGKTMLARAIAGESNCAFLSEAATTFVTKYQGSGPENIRELFARARRYAPAIVFIDEIDAIGANRADIQTGHVGHGEAMTLNQLLIEMDGFSKLPGRAIIVIAATNHPEKLDPALMRRFSRTIEVELPTRSERELYIHTRLEAKATHEVSDHMIERLAAQGQGMSIADLERILAQAAVMALSNQGVINDAIIAEAFEKVTMGEAKAGADPLRTARHEAGHALIMCTTGEAPIYVTIVGRGSFGGYAAFEDKEERRSQTRGDLENRICQLLGGHEAERLYYGEGDGDSTGPSNDLERATNIAEWMVYDLGMSKDVGFIKIDRRRQLPAELSAQCHRAVSKIIETQSDRCRQLLDERREGLDRLVQALMDRNRLLKNEVLELLAIPQGKQVPVGGSA